MPKITSTPKTQTQIQKESNARRGVKNKAFTLKLDDIELIKSLSKRLDIPQNQLIMDAVRAYQKGLD
ncbi:hypothetical protein [Moraxella catarrhalis]|uniref:hypothetical protein n=1 Tax=Moraxella catarrhalis TaxID=480 RepID=UPI0007E3F60E|nr:hypothetical protein [Moraxella catarrhalis]OAV28953.1 hypothetical protein AO369_0336 [Moraxella catarrhalis]OAV37873.1 hypothetical protein AO364_0018 [Moraxella catarrhalis]